MINNLFHSTFNKIFISRTIKWEIHNILEKKIVVIINLVEAATTYLFAVL